MHSIDGGANQAGFAESRQAGAATDLPFDDPLSLQSFGQGDVLFRSPLMTVRGWQGQQDVVPVRGSDHAGIVRHLAAQLCGLGRENDLVLGAVPFDASQPGCYAAPRQRWWRSSDADLSAMPPGQHAAFADAALAFQEVPDRKGYMDAVASALAVIQAGAVRKVVLARTLQVQAAALAMQHGGAGRLLARLLPRNRQGYTFAMPVTDADGEQATMIGASPELLVRKQGNRITLNPLAGSAARHADPVQDAAIMAQLQRSPKDLHEHAIVVGDIRQRLAPLCRQLQVPDVPSVISTDTLWHLSTFIQGELHDPGMTALEVALALHPTPAICGDPAPAAFRQLTALEPFDRGFFAGLVGWQNTAGDGEWAIALRCARMQGDRMRLYAGAGIVAGSDPEHEYQETATKLQTLRRAMTD